VNVSSLYLPLLVLVLATAGSLPTQAGGRNPTQDVAESPEARLAAIVARYQEARNELIDRMNAAETAQEQARIYRSADPDPVIAEFRALAFEHAGSEVAAEAWLWIVRVGRADRVDDAREAAEILVLDHLDSPTLVQLIDEVTHSPRLDSVFVFETLNTIRAESSLREVQAAAQFALAFAHLEQGETDEQRAAGRKRARELLVALQADFADVGDYAARAERALFEVDHLQIGMAAPDFEATDSDGVPFKLSDYRGKVVVVDFWGFW
jgi:hypothetical protein